MVSEPAGKEDEQTYFFEIYQTFQNPFTSVLTDLPERREKGPTRPSLPSAPATETAKNSTRKKNRTCITQSDLKNLQVSLY